MIEPIDVWIPVVCAIVIVGIWIYDLDRKLDRILKLLEKNRKE